MNSARLIVKASFSLLATMFFFAIFLFLIPTAASTAGVGSVSKSELSTDKRSVTIQCENAKIVIRAFERGIVSVEIFAKTINSNFETHMTLPGALKAGQFNYDASRGEASNSGIRINITKNPLAIDFADAAGAPLLSLAADGIALNPDGSYSISFLKEKGDRFFGMGEPRPGLLGDKKITLDFNKQVVDIWNIHPQSYIGMPFLMNPRGYGFIMENPYKASFDFKKAGMFTYSAEGGPLRFYVIPSRSFYNILDAYSQLTGRTPIPPRWVTGYMQSRSCFLDKKYFEWRVANFRKRRIPADVLIYDNYWSQQNPDGSSAIGNLKWNEKVFPDSLGWLKKTHRLGFKTIVIIQPYVSDNSLNYKEVFAKKLAATDGKGNQLLMCGGCYWKRQSLLLDFTNPATQTWFAQKVKTVHDTGVDAWWTDLTEPEWDSDDMVFHGGYHRNAIHNLYAFLMHKSIYDMYRKELPNERLFILSRSGFMGDWRYGAGIWSGDVHSTWDHFNDQVPIGLSASLSGYSLWNSDVGGFVGKPTPEIFVRWMQFGAFCPIYRAHGDASHEPWMFGDEAEKYNREIINLRYRLAPYLYTMFYEMHEYGRPAMRPMLLEFPEDERTYNIGNQYMYGPWILVAPVTNERAVSRKVYLPRGTWTDYRSGETIEGPKIITADAPLGRIPLYIREGAIIPMAPLMQYTDEKPVDPLTLDIYPGANPSSYKIYEDDGKTNRYLKGEFALTPVNVKPGGAAEITVGARVGRYSGMPARRAYIVIYHHAENIKGIMIEGKPARESKNDFDKSTPKTAAWNYNRAAKILRVYIPSRASGFKLEIEM